MRYIFVMIILCFITFLYANERTERITQELKETYTYLEDNEHALSIEELLADEENFLVRFEPFDSHNKSFGLTKSRLENQIIYSLIYGASIVMILYNFFLFLSIRSFLDTATSMPKIDRLLQVFLGLFVVAMIVTLTFDYHVGIVSSIVVIFMTTSSLVIVGFMAYYKNLRASKYYLLAWILLLIGAMLTGFKNIGILPIFPLTTWGLQLGAFFELVLLSFGLANVHEQSKIKLKVQVKECTQELQSANLLLKELHHRIKNNLQVNIAMMSLQKKHAKSEETKIVLNDANKRLQSIMMVHEMLYTQDMLSSINMKEYLQKLSQQLCVSFSNQNIDVVYRLEEIYLDLDRAISIGLICNEILTNAFKHAFDNTTQELKLYILLKQTDKEIILGIKDNGKGFDVSYESKDHLGLLLIQDLVAKLSDAHFTFKMCHGTYFRMEFLQ